MHDRELFDLYTDFLICSMGQVTSTSMSAMLDSAVSHDRISRMLGKREWTARDYWRLIKPVVRSSESDQGILKVDDTIEMKPHTTENELISWHYDHCTGKMVKGINIINFHYEPRPHEIADFSFPVAFELIRKTEQYADKKTGKIKRRSKKNKNQIVRERLRILHHLNKVKFSTVLWDSWFSSAKNMDFVHYELKKTFIGAIKSNRSVALSLEAKKQGTFFKVMELDWDKVDSRVVYFKGLDFPTLLAKQIFINKDQSRGELYLATNDLYLPFDLFTSTYQKRWGIEVLHRSLKQNTALEKSPTKRETTQANHVFASMAAWVKLELLSKKSNLNHYAFKTKLYIKALQTAFSELQKTKQVAMKLLPSPESKPTPLLA